MHHLGNQHAKHIRVPRATVISTMIAVVALLAAAVPAGAATPSWQTSAAMQIAGPDNQTVEHLA